MLSDDQIEAIALRLSNGGGIGVTNDAWLLADQARRANELAEEVGRLREALGVCVSQLRALASPDDVPEVAEALLREREPKAQCPDSGACHHGCTPGGPCWRVRNAAPLSVTGWHRWPGDFPAEPLREREGAAHDWHDQPAKPRPWPPREGE